MGLFRHASATKVSIMSFLPLCIYKWICMFEEKIQLHATYVRLKTFLATLGPSSGNQDCSIGYHVGHLVPELLLVGTGWRVMCLQEVLEHRTAFVVTNTTVVSSWCCAQWCPFHVEPDYISSPLDRRNCSEWRHNTLMLGNMSMTAPTAELI